MFLIEAIGWIGSLLLAVCAAPQAWTSFKVKHGKGVSALFLWMWVIGEILTLAYILLSPALQLPLIVNYSLNIFFILVILRYKYFPAKSEEVLRSKDEA